MNIPLNTQFDRKDEFNKLLGSITNDTPLLLFPLRIETHFRQRKSYTPKNDIINILTRFKELFDKLIEHKSDSNFNFIPLLARIREAIDSTDILPKDLLIDLASLNRYVFATFFYKFPNGDKKYQQYEKLIHKAISDVLGKEGELILNASIFRYSFLSGIYFQSSFYPTNTSAQTFSTQIPAPQPQQNSTQSPSVSDPRLDFPGSHMIYNFENAEAYRLLALVQDWIHIVEKELQKHQYQSSDQKELCVRIFPDEIFLDCLTEKLTQDEIDDGKYFWLQWYIASGSKKREYEAWQVLCDKYPIYRAAWIARSLKPEELSRFRIGEDLFYRRPYQKMEEIESACDNIYQNLSCITLSEDMVRHIDTDEYENEFEIRKYLSLIKENLFQIDCNIMFCEYIVDYLFDNIKSTIDYLERRLDSFVAFYRKFPGVYDSNNRQMELWDVDYTILKTFRSEVADFLEKLNSKHISLEEMIKKYLANPLHDFFPSVKVNEQEKPDIPISHILPDRFVFFGEISNKRIVCYSRKVKRNLQMGINPNEDMETEPYFIDENGNLKINGGIDWMVDYDKAEEAGMAITVPLDANINAFNYIYVLGIRSNDNEDKQYLHDLFNSHNYSTSGLEMLSTGIPTNLVEGGKQGYDSDPEAEMRRRYEIEIEEIFKTDAQRGCDSKILSDILHLDYDECWGHVSKFDNMELSNASKANEVLWSYFRKYVSVPNDPELNRLLDETGSFLINHVKGRGVLPSFRIGDQPYGILPVANFMQLKDNINEKVTPFIKRLNDLLVSLANIWKELRDTKVIDSEKLKGSDADKKYLEMAGQTPHSITFYERQMVETPLLPKRDSFADSYFESLERHGYFDPLPIGDAKTEVDIPLDLINLVKAELPSITEDECKMLISEFFDLFTYRLDAWFGGILNYFLRSGKTDYRYNVPKIGTFGWVFNLQENRRVEIENRGEIVNMMKLTSQNSADELRIYKNTDDDKGEYIVAPSIQHAISAAILRSAYLRTKKDSGDSHMCINLSSMRARQALRMISGIKSGMSTGIILGADLERYLHEAYRSEDEMDQYIYPLRILFQQVVDIQPEDERAQNYVMQVINGEALLNTFMERWDNSMSVSNWLARNCNSLAWYEELDRETQIGSKANGNHKKCLFKQIERIMDSYDALNDLLLAEGVHRLVQGNDAAYSAIIGFMSEGTGNLPEPSILDTPMERVVVSNRAGIVFPECKNPLNRPMCLTEPSVNLWLEQLMGTTENIWFSVERTDKSGNTIYSRCTLHEVGVTPIEYLYLSTNDNVFLAYLETLWRLKNDCLTDKLTLHTSEPESNMEGDIYDVDYEKDEENSFCLYENELRINSLRSLILRSRIMEASDLASAINDDTTVDDHAIVDDETTVDMDDLKSRYALLRASLSQLNAEMVIYLRELNSGPCSDEMLGKMYELLCKCVESGLTNSLPKYNSDIFLYSIDSETGQPRYRIDPIIQKPEFDATIEKQLSFIESFAFVQQQLDERIVEAEEIVKLTGNELYTPIQYSQAIQKLLLDTFKIFPRFTLTSSLTEEQKSSYDYIMKQGIRYYSNIDETGFQKWQSDIAEVREGMKLWHHVTMFQDMCDMNTGKVSILQIANNGDASFDKWLCCEVDKESDLQDVDSIVLYNSDAINKFHSKNEKISYNSGMIIDSWIEYIPYKKHTAGMVFHCDQPDNEAPQTLLLALHPAFNIDHGKRKWSLDNIAELLDSTRFMLMNRAVEPDLIYRHEELSKLFPLLSNISLPLRIPWTPSYSSYARRFDLGTTNDDYIFDNFPGGDLLRLNE